MNNDGDSRLTRSVEVNDRPFYVTQNLFEGLRRLREQSEIRILCIDAVCIDQSNSEEQSQQVASMARIFQQASEVLLWLGEGETESMDRATFDMFMRIGQAEARTKTSADGDAAIPLTFLLSALLHDGQDLCPDEQSLSCSICHALTSFAIPSTPETTSGEEWFVEACAAVFDKTPRLLSLAMRKGHILHQLASRRYWSRRWTAQELNSNQRRKMYWGPCSIDASGTQGDNIVRLVKCVNLALELMLLRTDPAQQERTKWLREAWLSYKGLYERLRDVHRIGRLGEDILTAPPRDTHDLLHALSACAGMNCSDPRDRLYSLLSFDRGAKITPDYSAKTTEVYIRFARHLIDTGHSGTLLRNMLRNSNPSGGHIELPSSVLDLRSPLFD